MLFGLELSFQAIEVDCILCALGLSCIKSSLKFRETLLSIWVSFAEAEHFLLSFLGSSHDMAKFFVVFALLEDFFLKCRRSWLQASLEIYF